MTDKLTITTNGIYRESYTAEELTQREADCLAQEQQVLLDSLTPSPDEIAKAERQIETIELLTELGVIA